MRQKGPSWRRGPGGWVMGIVLLFDGLDKPLIFDHIELFLNICQMFYMNNFGHLKQKIEIILDA